MRVIDLDGREATLDLRGRVNCFDQDRSGPHLLARQMLRDIFPHTALAEEVYLPGCGLYLDFFLPGYRLAVEVDGEQHRTYVAFFHKHVTGFVGSALRDNLKQRWCDVNGISLVRLDDGRIDRWREQLLGWRPPARAL